MKIRNGFVSNSSSSSYVVGYTGKNKETKFSDVYNLEALKKIKKDCIKNDVSIPSSIDNIECKFGRLEELNGDEIVSSEEESKSISDCVIHGYDNEIIIDVSKIPEGIKTIKIVCTVN